jgi:hypothetical protein
MLTWCPSIDHTTKLDERSSGPSTAASPQTPPVLAAINSLTDLNQTGSWSLSDSDGSSSFISRVGDSNDSDRFESGDLAKGLAGIIKRKKDGKRKLVKKRYLTLSTIDRPSLKARRQVGRTSGLRTAGDMLNSSTNSSIAHGNRRGEAESIVDSIVERRNAGWTGIDKITTVKDAKRDIAIRGNGALEHF